jgi:hypothetical protein
METDKNKHESVKGSAETRRLFHVLEVARKMHLADEDVSSLIFYLEQQYNVSAASPLLAFQDKVAQIEKRIEQDASFRQAYKQLQSKWNAIEAQLENPLAQFQRLTGHQVASTNVESVPTLGDSVAKAEPMLSTSGKPKSSRSNPTVRNPIIKWLNMKYAIAACLTLLFGYGALFVGSSQFMSKKDALGSVDSFRLEMQMPTVRGDVDNNEQLYYNALTDLSNAKKSYIGLFPYYDPTLLVQAKEKLQQVILKEQMTPERFRSNEPSMREINAQFFLAKTLLLIGDTQQAKRRLQVVVDAQQMKASDAKEVLEQLK